MRLVSLTCSNTEILWSLGLLDQLVGVDRHSDFPPTELEAVPRVGPDLDIDLDAVAALKPDLVLASLTVPGHERIVAGLEARGLPFLAPEPIRLVDVYGDILTIGEACGVRDRAEQVVHDMRQAMPARPIPAPMRPTILVEWWPKPVIVPGAQSWVTDLIALAGGRNPLSTDPVKSRPVEVEEACRLDPDAVVISWCGVPTRKYRLEIVAKRAGWESISAVQQGRIVPIAEAYLGRPGPRLVHGYRAFCEVVDGILAAT